MRIYLPASSTILAELAEAGQLGPGPLTAFAVTPSVREWYLDDEEDVLEYAVFTEAAKASLRLLDADPTASRRRAVIAADVEDALARPHPELDRAVIRLTVPLELAMVAAIHVDGPEAAADIAAAAAAIMAADLGNDDSQFTVDGVEDHELEWFDVMELGDVLKRF